MTDLIARARNGFRPTDLELEMADEIERLRDYARQATVAITELTGGGSEMFAGRIGEMYLADLPHCSSCIRRRFHENHERWVKSATRANQLADEIKRLRESLGECQHVLAIMIDPKGAGAGINTLTAWAMCTEAERKARNNLEKTDG